VSWYCLPSRSLVNYAALLPVQLVQVMCYVWLVHSTMLSGCSAAAAVLGECCWLLQTLC
jgi:hypothetical protein